MKSQSAALAAHRLGTTTLASCWLITRQDGQVYSFTNHDSDIVYDSVTYQSADGFNASAIAGSADLSVANLEVIGPVSTATINDDDVAAGLWDDATVEVFEVNYMDLSMGKMTLSFGTMGNVGTTIVQFRAEQRGPEQKLQQPIGRVYSPTCSADLGDSKCGINLPALQVSGTVTSVASRRAFTASAMMQVSDYFGGGVVTWTTGDNDGLSMEIQTFASGVFGLALNMPYTIQTGDTFTVVPGCRKRLTDDCKNKYNNVVNFRAFPYVPGNNKVIGNAGLASA